jgi:hypothetical protein
VNLKLNYTFQEVDGQLNALVNIQTEIHIFALSRGLLHKLKAYGMNGNLFDWFHSYLNEREKRVVIKDPSSSFTTILGGDPQGSVLRCLCDSIVEIILSSNVKLISGCSKFVNNIISVLSGLNVISQRLDHSSSSFYGINGNLFDWFHSYLIEREQRVVIKDASFSFTTILGGVPPRFSW